MHGCTTPHKYTIRTYVHIHSKVAVVHCMIFFDVVRHENI